MKEKTRGLEVTTLPVSAWREFKELRLRALQSEPQAFTMSYSKSLRDSDEKWQKRLRDGTKGSSLIIFARLDGKLVGMMGSKVETQKEKAVYIWGVYVEKSARNIGVASGMMQKLLDAWMEKGYKTFNLGVNSIQKAAFNLYKKFGFKAIGKERLREGDGLEYEEIVLQKRA